MMTDYRCRFTEEVSVKYQRYIKAATHRSGKRYIPLLYCCYIVFITLFGFKFTVWFISIGQVEIKVKENVIGDFFFLFVVQKVRVIWLKEKNVIVLFKKGRIRIIRFFPGNFR